jgi:beta-glucuronidase
MIFLKLTVFVALAYNVCAQNLGLYPRESETREVKKLDGVWNFRIIPMGDDQNIGFTQKWFSQPLQLTGNVIPMPVPSSFNDITQSREIRDYAGWVWYDLSFFVPNSWQQKSVTLRFGSVHYESIVYLNGKNVLNHTGGHLPFETYATKDLKYGDNNLITVAVNNKLSSKTIPQGSVSYKNDTSVYPKGFYETSTNFDFFNYAGIHRSVFLYASPLDHINDITVVTSLKDSSTGVITYTVTHSEMSTKPECSVDVLDKKGNKVTSVTGLTGSITISNATLWWPFTTNANPGYQYTLKVSLIDSGKAIDVYYLKVGIRTVEVKGSSFLINGKPFYFRGFGKHEDSNIRGKGLDFPLIIKDFNLIKWIGANSFRTSHYPYSEELMDEADAQGIVVIDECPAVGLNAFDDTLLKQHLQTITELIQRDKNRPSVVMWSIANEPHSSDKAALDYFKKVADHARSLDKTRPITAATMVGSGNDQMSASLDVLMVNRYYGWYSDTGYSQVIQKMVVKEIDGWFQSHKKPVMISEYGADTVAGLHMDPPFIFSEDYQVEFLMDYHKAFDQLIAKGYFIGEHIWNFADFMTNEQITRVIGNKKGIFTRERQPKAAARVLRCRYWKQAGNTYNEYPDAVSYCPSN